MEIHNGNHKVLISSTLNLNVFIYFSFDPCFKVKHDQHMKKCLVSSGPGDLECQKNFWKSWLGDI